MGLMIVAAMGVGAVGTYVTTRPAALPEELRRTERLPEHQSPADRAKRASQTDAPKPGTRDSVEIKTPTYDESGNLRFTSEQAKVPRNEDAYLVAINGFLAKADLAPAGAKAVKADLKDGILTIWFNEAFDSTYGTEDEQTLVNGILVSAGQFSEVRKVQFTIQGKPMETMGNIDLTSPLSTLRE